MVIFDVIQGISFMTVRYDVCSAFYLYGVVLNVSEVNLKAGELCKIIAHSLEIFFWHFRSLLPKVTVAHM